MTNAIDFLLTRIVGSNFEKSDDGVILLNEHKAYFCGRTEDNDIVCKSERVSQKHCIFFCYPDAIHIQDLNSEFGVFINGKRVKRYEVVKLNNNDIIGIGANTRYSDDLSKFIYQLQTAIVFDIECEYKSKRPLDSEENYSPSKIAKLSEEKDLLSTELSSDVHEEEVCRTDAKVDEVVSQIVAWKPEDFSFNKGGKLNQSIREQISFEPISKSYETYKEYNNMLSSNLLLEVAYKIGNAMVTNDQHSSFEKWEVMKNSGTKILVTGTNSYMLDFDLCITVSSSGKIPKVGDLIRLGISNEGCTMVFGYIRNVTTNSKRDQTEVTCSVMTKFLDIKIYTSKILNLRIITNLNFEISLIQTLGEFKSAPLLPLIIKPEVKDYILPSLCKLKVALPPKCSTTEWLMHMDFIGSIQFNAVMRINKAIASEAPNVCLIEGPAGTGKTKMIIDIILTVLGNVKLNNDLPPKVLVCANSKVEVDEIVVRFASVKMDLCKGFKIVYMGHCDEITDPRIKDYSLQFLSKIHVYLGIRELMLSVEKESLGEDIYKEQMKLLDEEYNELKFYSSAVRKYILDISSMYLNWKKHLKGNIDQEFVKLLEYVEKALVLEANAIITTLPICYSNLMDSLFGRKEEIPVCIIDNTTQIPEIEILKPLTFGVKKLILFGDPYKSFAFRNVDYKSEIEIWDNALFSRLKQNFSGTENNPMVKFNLQFRIHQELMTWMNKVIFGGNLRTYFPRSKLLLYSFRLFNFQPFYTDEDETTFVASLVFIIVEFANLTDFKTIPLTIGVIVPEAAKKLGMISSINASLTTTSATRKQCFKIDVDVISGFLNQERNVVIVSCTKEIHNQHVPVKNEWLYTAITRVRNSLIMYGSLPSYIQPCLLKSVIEMARRKRMCFNVNDIISPLQLKNCIIKKS